MELVWDFARQLDPAATPGSTVSYFDEMTQSFYIDSGAIRTQIGKLDKGQWQDLNRETEAIISDTGYGNLDIEHNFNDIVWGMAQHGSDVVLLMYEYTLDISSWLDTGTWQLQPDNPIKAGTVTVKNADRSKFEDDAHTLFSPGSKIRFNFRYGDSDPLPLGLFFIEDSPYSLDAESFAFRGRNRLGFNLSNQNIDERTHYVGTRTEVITQMLADAGIIPAAIMVETDTTAVDYVFDSSKNYFAVITETLALMGWYMDDIPDGTIVIGSAEYVKANAAKTGIYTFDLGAEVISMSRTRQADGVYSRLCVRRKGTEPLSIYSSIPYYEGWNIGAHRTYYQDVPETTDQTTMERIRDELVECMQYSGITETFKAFMQPQLQIGDVAVVVDGETTRISGIISEINHEFGREGFFTTFTVTSGGTISDPDNPATVATKYVNRLGGANRQRRLTDYLTGGASNTLSGTSTTGDRGSIGATGSPGTNGSDGASAYQVWLSLGNSGTEQDFIDSLGSNVLPAGAIQLWPTTSAPTDWMLCDGQAISRTEYAVAFALIGTTYGVGDGTSTFNLPTIADPVTGISYMIKVR